MRQTAFKMQAKTCMSYLPFPPGIHYFRMLYCIVFFGVIEKSCQKLVLRVSSGVPNTSKQEKHSACGLVLSSVSRCLEPLMKHSHSFLTYYMKSHMLVGERRVQSTVDRCSLLIPFRAIAGLPFNILQTLKIAAHFKRLFEF